MKTYKAKLINGLTIRGIKAKDKYFAARYASQHGAVKDVEEQVSPAWFLIYVVLLALGVFWFSALFEMVA